MTDFILINEASIRLVFFIFIFAVVAFYETKLPRRQLTVSKTSRWIINIGIVVINSIAPRFFFSAGAVGVAYWVDQHGWGIMNILRLPYFVSVIASVFILDFIIYLQHVMFHAAPAFWRLHMIHHADLDFDVTTGARFHPIEIWLSMVIKSAAILALGPPVLGVILFEVLLNGTAMFNHSNIKLPESKDKILRLFVVTPDMHRVHHSVFPNETNSNFGFNLPWWDWLLGTYRSQPRLGHEGMTIGLNQFREPTRLTLPWILVLPFIGNPGTYAINRRGQAPSNK
ncbi:MAG: sterol desaturase family protein [Deltaproteobacteria bacterium]|nr:sterol desaturase family protein [Deltaproteobacteria bacterium]